MKFDKYEKLGAYHWDWYSDPNYAWYKKCVDKCVEFCKGSTIDVGCGDGLLLSKLPKKSFGLDNDDVGLEIAFDKGLNVTGIDLNDDRTIVEVFGKYKYVCCLNTIEHLKDSTMLVNLVNHARKGAIIITDMPTEHKGRYHEHEYTKKELLDTFAEFKPKYFVINSTEFGKPIQFHGVEITK